MSALHLKYRPKTFDEVVGNRTLVKSLKSILERPVKEMPHSFLFQGQTGSGKTTLARIMCDMLECKGVDLCEMNMSKDRGIDVGREIVKKMKFKPKDSKVRCFILDEIQKGTKELFDALLKPLEDTPDHVFFFLCTTDPQKIPGTLRNRCTQFTVESLSGVKLVKLMKKIVQSEEIDIPLDVLSEISQIHDMSPRQALVLLDQIKDIDTTENMIDFVKRSCVEEKQIIDLCRALLNPNVKWNSVKEVLKGIPKEVRSDDIKYAVLGYMNVVLMGESKGRADNSYAASCIIDFFEKIPYSSERVIINNTCFKIKEEE